jgi:branched-chain amino acid transport system permease protein
VRLERPQLLRLGVAAGVLLFLFLAPFIFTNYQYGVLGTKILWLGIVAASLIFLAGYGGMVSLAQTALFGIAGFVVANLVVFTGWSEWPAVAVGILIATSVGLLFGLIASRSVGIYFLMITLAFAVIVFYFFAQVTKFSGFGGVNNVSAPGLIGNPRQDPAPLYYAALVVSVLVYFGIRYLVRTPFGLALQGVRDEPTRMRALGFNVHLHRTLAFGVGAFIASLAGVLSVWYNSQISPGSIDVSRTIDVLVIAVVGGLFRLEGAWIGALVFTVLDDQLRGETTRFNTVIGIVFLVIVLLSPGGLVGIWGRVTEGVRSITRTRSGGSGEPPQAALDEP